MISLLAAVDALSRVDGLSKLNKQVMGLLVSFFPLYPLGAFNILLNMVLRIFGLQSGPIRLWVLSLQMMIRN